MDQKYTHNCYLRSTIICPKSIRFDICHEYQVLVELVWIHGNCSSIRIFDTHIPGKVVFEKYYEYTESSDLVYRIDKNNLRGFIRNPMNNQSVVLLEDLTNLNVVLSFDKMEDTLQIECINCDMFQYIYTTSHQTTEMNIYALKCFVQ